MKSDEGIFKMLSKSSIIRNQYENVSTETQLKNSKTPEKSITLAFFLFSIYNVVTMLIQCSHLRCFHLNLQKEKLNNIN